MFYNIPTKGGYALAQAIIYVAPQRRDRREDNVVLGLDRLVPDQVQCPKRVDRRYPTLDLHQGAGTWNRILFGYRPHRFHRQSPRLADDVVCLRRSFPPGVRVANALLGVPPRVAVGRLLSSKG